MKQFQLRLEACLVLLVFIGQIYSDEGEGINLVNKTTKQSMKPQVLHVHSGPQIYRTNPSSREALGLGEIPEPARIGGKFWPKIDLNTRTLWERVIVSNLSSLQMRDRIDGRVIVFRMGEDAVPLLIEGLYSNKSYMRSECASLLGNLQARNATKYLIEALYAIVPDDAPIATYNRTFARALRDALVATTGQRFISFQVDRPLMKGAVQNYVDWYITSFDRLPPQVGEAILSPVDLHFMDKLSIMRRLILRKRAWPRPPLSADIVTGQAIKLGENQLQRPADKQFGKEIPMVDRETLGGLVREGDRKWSEDLLIDRSK